MNIQILFYFYVVYLVWLFIIAYATVVVVKTCKNYVCSVLLLV